MNLQDDLAACVGCGLCLPHCPTFRVTGEEALSPRGRITSIREFFDEREGSPPGVREILDSCVQCMGCESACPSGVQYGRILSATNRSDEMLGRRPPLSLRLFLRAVPRRRVLTVLARLALMGSLVPILRNVVPRRFRVRGVPWSQGPRLKRSSEEPDVWLFTGCIMDVWFRGTHRATVALLESVGCTVGTPRLPGLCCGALHMHSGRESQMQKLAQDVIASMPGSSPIVVDAAGCGAMLKDYGSVLATLEAQSFSSRVIDVHEWIQQHTNQLLHMRNLPRNDDPLTTVIVQEPCHLRHVQKVSIAETLEPFVPVRRLADDDICCGAGGAYSMVQYDLSRAIRLRKIEAIRAAAEGRDHTVVTGNPGCHLHLAADGVDMCSSVEMIADVLGVEFRTERRKT